MPTFGVQSAEQRLEAARGAVIVIEDDSVVCCEQIQFQTPSHQGTITPLNWYARRAFALLSAISCAHDFVKP